MGRAIPCNGQDFRSEIQGGKAIDSQQSEVPALQHAEAKCGGEGGHEATRESCSNKATDTIPVGEFL